MLYLFCPIEWLSCLQSKKIFFNQKQAYVVCWSIVLLCLIIYSFFLEAKELLDLIPVFPRILPLVSETVTLAIMDRKLDWRTS